MIFAFVNERIRKKIYQWNYSLMLPEKWHLTLEFGSSLFCGNCFCGDLKCSNMIFKEVFS